MRDTGVVGCLALNAPDGPTRITIEERVETWIEKAAVLASVVGTGDVPFHALHGCVGEVAIYLAKALGVAKA